MVSKTSRQPLSYKYRDHDYPDVESCGFDDFAPIRYDCGTTTVEATYYKHREGRPPLSTNEFEYVVDSVESYLDVHGVETISVPAYYSEFDEFEPVVSEWTATGRGVAKGISQRVLEGAVRLADGGGHINHDALSVTLGDDGKFLVNGERGAFLVEQVTLKERATDEIERPATEYDTVGGLLVLEGNETAREGLRRFISIFNFYTDAKLVKYEGLYDGKHVYKTDSGDNVYVNKPQRLAEAEQVLEEVAGEYTYTVDCQTFKSDWTLETTHYQHGQELDRAIHNGYVVGFNHRWREEDYIMGNSLNKVISEAEYLIFEPKPDNYDYFDYDLRVERKPLDEFDVSEEGDTEDQ